MNVVRSITRHIAHWSITIAPTTQEVLSHLVESNGRNYVKTPWAMLDAPSGRDTSDAQLAAPLTPCFATEPEAQVWANRSAPHWHDARNDAVRCRLVDAMRWHGDFSGPERLADAIGVDADYVRKVARGEKAATPKQAHSAREWRGGKV